MKKYFNQVQNLIKTQTIKDSLVSLGGNIFVAAVGVVFTIIAARALQPEKFGIFSALVAASALLVSLGDMGFSSTLINFIPKLKDSKSLISTAFWLQIGLGVFLGLVVVFGTIAREKIIPGTSAMQFLLTGMIVGTFIFENFFINLLRAQKLFWIATGLMAADALIKLIIFIWLYKANFLSIESFLWAGLISGLLVALVGFRFEAANIKLLFSYLDLRKMLTFVKWIAVIHVLGVAMGRIETIFLVSLGSAEEAGLFAAANRMTLVFILFVSSLSMVTAPRFSSFTTRSQTKKYMGKVFLMTLGVAALMLITMGLANPLVTWIFGSKYILAVPLFRYLTLATLPFLFSLVVVNPLIYFFNEPSWVAAATVIQLITAISIDVMFIPSGKAMAAVAAIGISQTLTLVITGFRLWQKLRLTA